MQNLFYQISQVLGITIIHSLWQGLIVFAALRLLLLLRPKLSAAAKHNAAFTALTLILAWFVYTLYTELNNYNWAGTTALQQMPFSLPIAFSLFTTPANRAYFAITGYMPYITGIYIAGLLFNILKIGLAWFKISQIRRSAIASGYQGLIDSLSRQLGISKTTRVAYSGLIDVPCLMGFAKPLILLPLSISTYLSAEEIKAILLHELAHVKRNDYLLNLVQQIIGMLLFFNPFSRLINNIINAERENCCDDMVVHTAEPLVYAQTLLKLEQNRTQSWQLALAATGKKHHLLTRIERIMKTKTTTLHLRPALITLLALTCAISSIAWLNPKIKDGKIDIKKIPAVAKIAKAFQPAIPLATPVEKPTRLKSKKAIPASADTAKFSYATDTSAKKGKFKYVIENGKGEKKTYYSVNDIPVEDQLALAGEFTYSVAYHPKDSITELIFKKADADAMRSRTEWRIVKGMEVLRQANTPESLELLKKLTLRKLDISIARRKGKSAKADKKLQQSDDELAGYFKRPEFARQIADFSAGYDNPALKKQIAEAASIYNKPDFKNEVEKIQATFAPKKPSALNGSPVWRSYANPLLSNGRMLKYVPLNEAQISAPMDTPAKKINFQLVIEKNKGEKSTYYSVNDIPADDASDLTGRFTYRIAYQNDSTGTITFKKITTDEIGDRKRSRLGIAMTVLQQLNTSSSLKLLKKTTLLKLDIDKELYNGKMEQANKLTDAVDTEMSDYFNSNAYHKRVAEMGTTFTSNWTKNNLVMIENLYKSIDFKVQVEKLLPQMQGYMAAIAKSRRTGKASFNKLKLDSTQYKEIKRQIGIN